MSAPEPGPVAGMDGGVYLGDMSERRTIRAYDYVNHPYERVRDAIKGDPQGIFRRATAVAEDRTEAVAASLSVNLASLEVRKGIEITVGETSETQLSGPATRMSTIDIQWQAEGNPALFPQMHAELRVFPLSPRETQIELVGTYDPPMGVLGNVLDAAVGHRIAEASVHRFVKDVVDHLRRTLSSET